jgi:hypothetical protein
VVSRIRRVSKQLQRLDAHQFAERVYRNRNHPDQSAAHDSAANNSPTDDATADHTTTNDTAADHDFKWS